MYSMVLDSVREQNLDNLIMAEVSMMRSALMGNPVVLSPNQAMDSLALQEIILANNAKSFRENYFCKAVEMGIVRIAMPREPRVYRGLVDYCIDALQRGLDEPAHEFIISGLKFLYDKDTNSKEIHPYEQRCSLLRYILARLQNTRRINQGIVMPDWISSDEKELVEQYIESIVLLDKAVDVYEDFTYQKHLLVHFLRQQIAERLKYEELNTAVYFLLTKLFDECSRQEAPIYRSYYYRFIGRLKPEYGADAVEEAKTIIDIAYNKTMALSVQSSTEISIPGYMESLSKSIVSEEKPLTSVQSSYRVDTDGINWEMMVWLYAEIDAAMNERGCTWKEAVEEIYVRESKLPIYLHSKYFMFGAFKTVVSRLMPVGGELIIEFISSLINDEASAIIQEKVNIPGSYREAKKRSNQSKRAVKMLDNIFIK